MIAQSRIDKKTRLKHFDFGLGVRAVPVFLMVSWESIPGVAHAAFSGWGVTALGLICILQ